MTAKEVSAKSVASQGLTCWTQVSTNGRTTISKDVRDVGEITEGDYVQLQVLAIKKGA